MADIEAALDRFIDKMGKVTAAQVELDKAAYDERNIRPRCGNCYWWMKSRDCPLERNVNGYSRGPSMNEAPCGKFQEKADVQFLRDRAAAHRARAAELLASI